VRSQLIALFCISLTATYCKVELTLQSQSVLHLKSLSQQPAFAHQYYTVADFCMLCHSCLDDVEPSDDTDAPNSDPDSDSDISASDTDEYMFEDLDESALTSVTGRH
jgi:hypothetical protein